MVRNYETANVVYRKTQITKLSLKRIMTDTIIVDPHKNVKSKKAYLNELVSEHDSIKIEKGRRPFYRHQHRLIEKFTCKYKTKIEPLTGISFVDLQKTCHARKIKQTVKAGKGVRWPCLDGGIAEDDYSPDLICNPCNIPIHCHYCPACPALV